MCDMTVLGLRALLPTVRESKVSGPFDGAYTERCTACNTIWGIHQTVCSCCNASVTNEKDRAANRRRILQALIDDPSREWKGVQSLFAKAAKRSPTQISDMLLKRKSFGDKLARSLCEQLGLPSDYFEQPPGQPAAPSSQPQLRAIEGALDPVIVEIVELLRNASAHQRQHCLKLVRVELERDLESENRPAKQSPTSA